MIKKIPEDTNIEQEMLYIKGNFYPLEVMEKTAASLAAFLRLKVARRRDWELDTDRSKAERAIAEYEWGEAFEARRQALIKADLAG